MTMPQRYRVAVLSAVKHDYVIRGLASHPRFELVVVADDPQIAEWAHQRNQQLADSFKIPYIRDVEQALRVHNIQVAVVCSEAFRHCNLSTRAANLGINVVQDKPLTTRRADAERLWAAVKKNKVKFMMWNRNFLPALLHAKERIAAGAIGEIVGIHVDFYFAKDAGPPKAPRALGYPPMDWLAHQIAAHMDGSDGGLGPEPIGELENEGVYPLGFIFELTASRVKRVFARSTAHFHQLNADNRVEDLASMTLELNDGTIGSIALGRIGLASHPSGGEIKLRIVGSTGAMVIHEGRPEVGIYYRNQPPGEARQRRVGTENDFLLAEQFVQALDNDSQPLMNIEDSMHVFATIQAALQSCRIGQPVEVLSL